MRRRGSGFLFEDAITSYTLPLIETIKTIHIFFPNSFNGGREKAPCPRSLQLWRRSVDAIPWPPSHLPNFPFCSILTKSHEITESPTFTISPKLQEIGYKNRHYRGPIVTAWVFGGEGSPGPFTLVSPITESRLSLGSRIGGVFPTDALPLEIEMDNPFWFAEKLFQIDTYTGCRIFSADPDTLVVENLGGQPIRLRFRRALLNWQVHLHVYVSGFANEHVWLPLSVSQRVMKHHMRFWDALAKIASQQRAKHAEHLTSETARIIRVTGNDAAPPPNAGEGAAEDGSPV